MCLPVVQILTFYPLVILTAYVPCTHLSLTITLTQKYVKNSLSSKSKHSHSQKNHSLPSGLLTKNHTLLLPKNTQSFTPIVHAYRARGRQLLCSAVAGRLTHSHCAMRFASLEITEIWSCMQTEPRKNSCSSVQLLQVDQDYCFLIFEI